MMGIDLWQCSQVLPLWEIKLPAPWPRIPFGHITLTLTQPVLALSLMPSAWLGSDKYQLIFISHRFIQPGTQTLDFPHARLTLYRCIQRAWCQKRIIPWTKEWIQWNSSGHIFNQRTLGCRWAGSEFQMCTKGRTEPGSYNSVTHRTDVNSQSCVEWSVLTSEARSHTDR